MGVTGPVESTTRTGATDNPTSTSQTSIGPSDSHLPCPPFCLVGVFLGLSTGEIESTLTAEPSKVEGGPTKFKNK